MRMRSIVDIGAEAIARSELTEKGVKACVWPRDWGPNERQEFRKKARAALKAWKAFLRVRS